MEERLELTILGLTSPEFLLLPSKFWLASWWLLVHVPKHHFLPNPCLKFGISLVGAWVGPCGWEFVCLERSNSYHFYMAFSHVHQICSLSCSVLLWSSKTFGPQRLKRVKNVNYLKILLLIAVAITVIIFVIFTTNLFSLGRIMWAKEGLVYIIFLSILSSISKELANQQLAAVIW